jgi:DNA-binding SARP family transcriptional activator
VIRVRVLGPLEVTVSGAIADLGGPRQRCVLARLIAAHGRVVSADRLIEDLYADEAPPRALAALQSYVSHLRRALEPGRTARTQPSALVTAPPGYALRLEHDAVDAWTFEDEVHRAAGLTDAAAVHDCLSAALAAWHDSAFQEFGGLPWADLEATRLDELRLTATERRADAALRLGRAAEVVADLDGLAVEHPLREEVWRLLALALYQAGRQGDALAALRRARARLAADLGVDPGPALRELEDAILTQAPHLLSAVHAAPPAPVSAAPRPVGTGLAGTGLASTELAPLEEAIYVGRDAELGQLIRSAQQASAGRMRIALVAGDAGAGKTALSGQVGLRLAAEGWIVTTGRCPEHDGAPAGWPWAQALRQLSRIAAPPDPVALAPLLTDSTDHDGDAAAARFRLHQAVADYLRAASRTGPLLLVLEDLHRADGETLATLAHITADLGASRLLVLGTYRTTEVGQQLAGCLATLASREPHRITLGGLDAAAADELIRATCTSAIDSDTAHKIAERTGGNPFFIREAARLYDSEGTLAATTGVPAGVRDVLQRRIARLPATAQTILGQAAVIGPETDVDVLGEVAEAEEQVLLDAVEAGLLTGLVTEPVAGRIRFAHALVRDTLYDRLSRLRRSRLHARAAAAIERHSPSEFAALAYHFTEAGSDPVKATQYCRLAAMQAEQRFAYHEATRLWEQAIDSFDKAGGSPARDRLELVLGLVRTLAHTGQLARARSYRRDCVRAAEPLDDAALLGRVITAFDVPMLWQTHEYGRHDHELVGVVEQTLTRLPPGEQLLRCRLLTTLAFELEGAESERGYPASAEAVDIARQLADPDALTIAINGRYTQSFRHDGLAERLSLGTELLALPAKQVTTEALAHLMIMQAKGGAGDFEAADLHADEAGLIADRYDIPVVAVKVGCHRAMRAALTGDIGLTDERYRQVGRQLNAIGMWEHGVGTWLLGMFCCRVMQDRAADSLADLERVHGLYPWTGPFAETYALTLAAAGRTAEARAAAPKPYFRHWDAFWLVMAGVRGLLAVALDDRERAEWAYQALLPYADRPTGADTGIMTLGPAAQILGDLAGYLGLPAANTHYQHALVIAERAGVPLWRDAAIQRMAQLAPSERARNGHESLDQQPDRPSDGPQRAASKDP